MTNKFFIESTQAYFFMGIKHYIQLGFREVGVGRSRWLRDHHLWGGLGGNPGLTLSLMILKLSSWQGYARFGTYDGGPTSTDYPTNTPPDTHTDHPTPLLKQNQPIPVYMTFSATE